MLSRVGGGMVFFEPFLHGRPSNNHFRCVTQFPPQPHEVGPIIISILQMRIYRSREVE